LSDDSNGVVFVLNPNEASHAKELNQWFTFFIKDSGLREEVCLVIVNRFTTEDGNSGRGDVKLCMSCSYYTQFDIRNPFEIKPKKRLFVYNTIQES